MEIWKDVKGYEGLYQISNYGRVKSIRRVVLRSGRTGPYQTVEGKILANRYDKKGYLQVRLYSGGESSYPRVHRLVADAFLDNPSNLPQVNHKDRQRDNNCVDNLEWVSVQRNTEHGVSNYYLFVSPQKEPVIVYNLSSFCKDNNLTMSNMLKVLKGKRNHHKGWTKYGLAEESSLP